MNDQWIYRAAFRLFAGEAPRPVEPNYDHLDDRSLGAILLIYIPPGLGRDNRDGFASLACFLVFFSLVPMSDHLAILYSRQRTPLPPSGQLDPPLPANVLAW